MKFRRRASIKQPGPDDVVGVQRRNLADALFKGVVRCRFQRVKFLLDNGVSPLVVNDAGQNILIAALYIPDDTKRDTMFQYLAKRGADCCFVDKTTGRDVTAWAAYLGRAQEVKSIFEFVVGEVNLHAKDKTGMTPLHHAVTTGHVEVVNVLVKNMQKYDLSLDIPDDRGLTPYIYARRLGYIHIADALAEGGCSTDQFDMCTFRSADEWAEIGRQERRREMIKEIGMEKAGLISRPKVSVKLPALKITSSDNKDAVVIKFNDNDSNYAKSEMSYFSHAKKSKKRQLRSRRSSVESLASNCTEMRLREDTSLLLSLASSSTNSLTKQSISDNICSIMDIVAQQCTHTFREGVQPPALEQAPGHKGAFSSLAFLIRSNKKKIKQNEMGKAGVGTVMSAFSATKQLAAENEKKKRRTPLPPISG